MTSDMSEETSIQDKGNGDVQQARDIAALVDSISPRLTTSLARQSDISYHLQTIQQRAANFIRLWGTSAAREAAQILDQCAVTLWNASPFAKRPEEFSEDDKARQALLRGSAALMTYASTKMPYTMDDTVHLLRVLSKAAAAQSATGLTNDVESAEELLTLAAQIHSGRSAFPQWSTDKEAFKVSQGFHLAKHAWARVVKNDSVAGFALQQAYAESEECPGSPSASTMLQLASACVFFGESLIQAVIAARLSSQAQLATATEWLRKAVRILERTESSSLPQIAALQTRALATLARALFETALGQQADAADSAFQSAETALDELQKLQRASMASKINDEPLRLLRVQILLKRKAPLKRLVQALTELHSSGSISGQGVELVLSALRTYQDQWEFIGEVAQPFLRHLTRLGHELEPTILRTLTLLLRNCKNSNGVEAIHLLLNELSEANFELGDDHTCALQIMCWTQADTFYKRALPDYCSAAAFYKLAAHKAFSSMGQNVARSLRKVALCHIEAGQLDMARQALRLCPASMSDDAINHFLQFRIQCGLGSQDEAMTALSALLGAPNFKTSMLPSVVQLAQEAGFEEVIYQAMQNIAERTKTDTRLAKDVDSVVLTRSLIKYQLALPEQTSETIEGLLKHFDNNLRALKRVAELDPGDVKSCHEAGWSYKTCYNAALSLSGGQDIGLMARMFDMAFSLAQCRQRLSAQVVDKGFEKTLVSIKLPAIVARALLARDGAHLDYKERRLLWFRVKEDSRETFQLIGSARGSAGGSAGGATPMVVADHFSSSESALHILDYESTIRLQDWAEAERLIRRASEDRSVHCKILETFADLTWSDLDAPKPLLRSVLKLTIERMQSQATVDGPSGSVPNISRLARWIRALITSALDGAQLAVDEDEVTVAKSADATTYEEVLTYFDQAKSLVLSHNTTTSSSSYPSDEHSWLLATAWDTGIDLYHIGAYDEVSRRFCQVALDLAVASASTSTSFSITDGGKEKSDKDDMMVQRMREQMALLTRHAADQRNRRG